jgi:aminoglycoside phosphotransferase (APT) family kinase protein
VIEDIIRRLGEVGDRGIVGTLRRASYMVYTNRGERRSSSLVFIFPSGSREPRVIVKLSQDTASIAREFNALDRLSSQLPRHVPRPYLHGERRGFGFVAMEAVAGGPIPVAAFEHFAGDIVRKVIEIHSLVKEGAMSDDVRRAELLEPLSEFERTWTSGHEGLRSLCCSVRTSLEGLRTVGLPRVFQHGDFCLDNLIARPDRSVVVIDWEDFGAVGLPAYDLVSLFVSLDGREPFTERSLERLLTKALYLYMDRLKLDSRWLGVLVPLGMMRFAMFCAAKGRPDPTRLTMSRLEVLADMTKRGAGLLTGLA